MSIEMMNEIIGTLDNEFKKLKSLVKMLKAEIKTLNYHNKELLDKYHILLAEKSDLQSEIAEMRKI